MIAGVTVSDAVTVVSGRAMIVTILVCYMISVYYLVMCNEITLNTYDNCKMCFL